MLFFRFDGINVGDVLMSGRERSLLLRGEYERKRLIRVGHFLGRWDN